MIERKGVCIGVDVGTARVGVARYDPDGILTIPVETFTCQEDRSDIDRIGEIVDEFLTIEVVVGLPRHLKDDEGVSAEAARRHTLRIKTLKLEIRVALVDEHLTSNQAYARLRVSGIFEEDHRPITDQVAAWIILEQALREEYMSGCAPGKEIILERSNAQR